MFERYETRLECGQEARFRHGLKRTDVPMNGFMEPGGTFEEVKECFFGHVGALTWIDRFSSLGHANRVI